jgi:hypothetical protein
MLRNVRTAGPRSAPPPYARRRASPPHPTPRAPRPGRIVVETPRATTIARFDDFVGSMGSMAGRGEGDKKLSTAQLMELLRLDAGSRLPIAVEALARPPSGCAPPLRVGCVFD